LEVAILGAQSCVLLVRSVRGSDCNITLWAAGSFFSDKGREVAVASITEIYDGSERH